ncbi:MAG: 50S ribosomal protein L19 [Candidatus Yanofskybacteria bacterium CG10_big_fil_rev_8_21_14_0_10_36_16]|uniref:Large ribosomal subunit protein bL19 n=1 Tax=Candidatus Yanofskybacteria bacterium CG10_big_fil_rev_8_21_14_0_10_36_16 TaxID=1975096 RepID=A0A2J0Q941_9BACT|nr:MAG: 50S ribosomal protein L19 [Candidatus Yanofskybacteria bacterium CG10_big_fil_rev_8_21_14_0_10_36_16]
MDAVQIYNLTQKLKELPEIRPGFTVRVHQRIKEGEKSRIQVFEGLVIARKHGKGVNSTITVRKTASGVGVERIFPLHSPVIEKFEVIKIAKTRRAKLYYIREKAAKEIRKKMKTSQFQDKLKEIQEQQNETENTNLSAEQNPETEEKETIKTEEVQQEPETKETPSQKSEEDKSDTSSKEQPQEKK